MRLSTLMPLLLFLIASLFTSFGAFAEPLDPTLKPETSNEISHAYSDIGIVENRAMLKQGRFLLSTYASFEFSDTPYSMHAIDFNPGYAFSESLEVYLNLVPIFASSPRDALNGNPNNVAPKPQFQVGAEVLWSPFYGKDSLGFDSLLRSDTFFKFTVADVAYSGGSGFRVMGGAGKTYFFNDNVGARFAANIGIVQAYLNTARETKFSCTLELGAVFYFGSSRPDSSE